MALENIHLTILKEYIDELIINAGILKIENPEKVIEKVKIDFLVKLAFRFYSKLYSSEKYSSFLHDTIDHLDNPNDKKAIFQDLMNTIHKNSSDNIQCLNCNILISQDQMKFIGDSLPLCTDCQNTIGLEMEIWEKIFGEK